MNAVEIEQAISDLALQPFDRGEFPYAFLQAFGNKGTTLKRLRAGGTNKSDLGGVLQTSNIHMAVCEPGAVTAMLAALKASPATARAKAKFILATSRLNRLYVELLKDNPDWRTADRRRRGARRAGHALHQRAQHPESAQPAVSG